MRRDRVGSRTPLVCRVSSASPPDQIAGRIPREKYSMLEPPHRSAAMFDEDLTPKKKLAHEIGQDLTLLSVEELADRIALLRQEIARLDEAMAKKRASLAAADQVFKR